jgi:hypothetical protein
MKPQDILFIIILIAFFVGRKPKYVVILGLICLLISLPLFQLQIFFTAQRLVQYAAGFFFMAIILFWIQNRK